MSKSEGKRIDKIYAERDIATGSCFGCKYFDFEIGDCNIDCSRNFDCWAMKGLKDKYKPFFLVRRCKAKRIREMRKLYVFYPQRKVTK
ncbi:hypothetical protein [Pectinatus frisingensis]|uniref:hypothetical protein n=1 Tax=Pectinatus frisingensis TaxID=865 RepID=UPI0018C72F50|nr:hypothetical protein [Pectinatus frisingensis]